MPWLGKTQRARLPPLNYGSLPLSDTALNISRQLHPSQSALAGRQAALVQGNTAVFCSTAVCRRLGASSPGLWGGMTGRTQQRFHAIYFHERRVGGTRSPKENPAEVPLAAKDRVGAPLSKGPFGRDGISTVRFLEAGGETRRLETFASIHRKKEMPPPRAYTA